MSPTLPPPYIKSIFLLTWARKHHPKPKKHQTHNKEHLTLWLWKKIVDLPIHCQAHKQHHWKPFCSLNGFHRRHRSSWTWPWLHPPPSPSPAFSAPIFSLSTREMEWAALIRNGSPWSCGLTVLHHLTSCRVGCMPDRGPCDRQGSLDSVKSRDRFPSFCSFLGSHENLSAAWLKNLCSSYYNMNDHGTRQGLVYLLCKIWLRSWKGVWVKNEIY